MYFNRISHDMTIVLLVVEIWCDLDDCRSFRWALSRGASKFSTFDFSMEYSVDGYFNIITAKVCHESYDNHSSRESGFMSVSTTAAYKQFFHQPTTVGPQFGFKSSKLDALW